MATLGNRAGPPGDVHEGELRERTGCTPERVILGEGIEILLDVRDDRRIAGLMTGEGRSGFLAAMEHYQVQYLVMSPWLYSAEHVHDYGFIIFTVQGRWVLCSKGERCLMRAGSLCSVPAGSSTGMELPFPEPARLLFILEGGKDVQRRYEDLLRRVMEGKVAYEPSGMVSILGLPDTHPARIFAARITSGSMIDTIPDDSG
ncbi:MAG: hypothetical protein A4E29_00803 [Methanomassiliicoccales archaeon PtaB.Bin134]|mgnify:CR=1 FL=1|nr:MAG: hypothetical protein A4E29_00803 [Methanomassiliicoccales archaeon PtaB.Bin134]